MDEILSSDSFIRMLLREYKDFREVVRYDKTPPDPRCQVGRCFIFDYQRNMRMKKASVLSQSGEALMEYSRSRKKNKYILLEAMELALSAGVIGDEEFIALFCKLTGERNLTADDTQLIIRYKYTFLFGCIDDFFINKGFSVVTGEKKETGEEEQVSYTNELEMWCEYCRYSRRRNIPVFGAENDILNDVYEHECTAELDMLNECGADDSFIPLYFDARNGAGIYIIGSTHIPENKRTAASCRVCVTNYLELLGYENEILTLDMEAHIFDTVAEAFLFYRENSFRFAENYHDDNSSEDITNVRPAFRQFFEQRSAHMSRQEMYASISADMERSKIIARARGEKHTSTK